MMRYFIATVIMGLIISCMRQNVPVNKILTINNLENFFTKDYHDDLTYLTAYALGNQKEVRSISIYRYSSGYQQYLLTDSIFFNRSGKPVFNFHRTEVNEYSVTHFFYDKNGNRYLDVTVGSNKYDTTYVLRKYDDFNRICKEISYNATQKEYGTIFVTNITPVSDSLINIRYEFYESYLGRKNILPFETRDIQVKILNDSIVQTNTNRIVQYDTSSNSSYSDLYKIQNSRLVRIDNREIIDTKTSPSCFEMRNNQCAIKRRFYFYTQGDKEITSRFLINQSIVETLDTKIDSLPIIAWEQYRKNLSAFSERNKILEAGRGNDTINLSEGHAIAHFTPQLWHIVSQDSGRIKGIKDLCYVVGYNTSIKNEDGFNKRCLAIYERRDGKFMLRKQSFGALEDFNDYGNDLLFDTFDEINFNVTIDEGKIAVNYNYMRGGASYVFSLVDGKWILVRFESNHRTCCQFESYSYDYITKEYSFSVYNTGEDTKGDTAFTVIQKRPIVYMDSINIRQFDYNETGLIVK